MTVSVFSKDEKFLLIEAVESRPALWNSEHANYRNAVITARSWKEVADHVNSKSGSDFSWLACKRQYKNLHDMFRVNMKQYYAEMKYYGDDIEKIRITWMFWKSMQFLKDQIGRRIMIADEHASAQRLSTFRKGESMNDDEEGDPDRSVTPQDICQIMTTSSGSSVSNTAANSTDQPDQSVEELFFEEEMKPTVMEFTSSSPSRLPEAKCEIPSTLTTVLDHRNPDFSNRVTSLATEELLTPCKPLVLRQEKSLKRFRTEDSVTASVPLDDSYDLMTKNLAIKLRALSQTDPLLALEHETKLQMLMLEIQKDLLRAAQAQQ